MPALHLLAWWACGVEEPRACSAAWDLSRCCAEAPSSGVPLPCIPALSHFGDGERCLAADVVRARSIRPLEIAPCPRGGPAGWHPVYFYLHVSKTGGASVTQDLQSIVAVDASYRNATLAAYTHKSREHRHDLLLWAAPENTWSHVLVSPRIAGVPGVRLILVLRKPADHVLSMYKMCQTDPYHTGRKTNLASGMATKWNESLPEWLGRWQSFLERVESRPKTCLRDAMLTMTQSCRLYPIDYQTVFIGGARAGADAGEGRIRRRLALFNTIRAAQLCGYAPQSHLRARALARAKGLVDKAWVVGVTERISDMWRVLIARMGLPPAGADKARAVLTHASPSSAKDHGTRTSTFSVSVGILRVIGKLTPRDAVLHARALLRLDDDMRALFPAEALRRRRRG